MRKKIIRRYAFDGNKKSETVCDFGRDDTRDFFFLIIIIVVLSRKIRIDDE